MLDYLTGGYDHQIDAKNRIRIPSRLRGNEDRLYFAKGTGGSIFVFFVKDMNEYLETLKKDVKMTDIDKQRGLRIFTHSIKLVEMDQQGRFVIPQELLEHARITKDVKICGTSDRIEIWDKDNYEDYMFGTVRDEEYAKYVESYDKLFSSLSVI